MKMICSVHILFEHRFGQPSTSLDMLNVNGSDTCNPSRLCPEPSCSNLQEMAHAADVLGAVYVQLQTVASSINRYQPFLLQNCCFVRDKVGHMQPASIAWYLQCHKLVLRAAYT